MLSALFSLLAPQQVPTGQALLDDVSRRAVRFFVEQSNPDTGLTRDRATNFEVKDQRRIASIAATGFALPAYAIGAKRGWISRSVALKRTHVTLDTLLNGTPRHKGWYYHFLDWQTGKREWKSELSSIDTAILVGGLVMIRQAWSDPAISKKIDRIIGGIDWQWMLTDGGAKPDSLLFCHGWNPENGFLEHRWHDYSEQMILYILGLGADRRIPAKAWEAWKRNAIKYQGIDLLMGGPLFMHQLSQGFLDFKDKRDRLGYNYWIASRQATLANRAFCIANPKKFEDYGPDLWGLSAGDGPDGYSAFGGPGWGDDNGTLIPTSAIASIMFTPDLSRRAADNFALDYEEAYGRYGFANGINPQRNWHSPDVVAIDLGMVLLAIENARDGLPHRWSMSHPIVKKGFERAGFRRSTGGALRRTGGG